MQLPKLPNERLFARIRKAAAEARSKPGWLDRKHRPKPPPGVLCPYLRIPLGMPNPGMRFRCFVHQDAQAQADNDWICRKLCLPKGGPFKQTIRPRGIPTGGRMPTDFRGLDIPKWQLPTRPSPNQKPPRTPMRRRVFGRRVA